MAAGVLSTHIGAIMSARRNMNAKGSLTRNAGSIQGIHLSQLRGIKASFYCRQVLILCSALILQPRGLRETDLILEALAAQEILSVTDAHRLCMQLADS